jgi:hypothetical protein
VIVVASRAFSQPGQEREVAWPAGWRLPVAGETVLLPGEFGGFVRYVEFSPVEQVVRLVLS